MGKRIPLSLRLTDIFVVGTAASICTGIPLLNDTGPFLRLLRCAVDALAKNSPVLFSFRKGQSPLYNPLHSLPNFVSSISQPSDISLWNSHSSTGLILEVVSSLLLLAIHNLLFLCIAS